MITVKDIQYYIDNLMDNKQDEIVLTSKDFGLAYDMTLILSYDINSYELLLNIKYNKDNSIKEDTCIICDYPCDENYTTIYGEIFNFIAIIINMYEVFDI